LEVAGQTAAVLGTDLAKVYPRENRALAEWIVGGGGCLVSELKLGAAASPRTFVDRDRVQSGLSVGVIAVQTGVSGGTMHTVRFAESQRRLVYCPKPLARESRGRRYEGILALIASGRARMFEASDYHTVESELRAHRRWLFSEGRGEESDSSNPGPPKPNQISMNL
jgi:DNA processing protein